MMLPEYRLLIELSKLEPSGQTIDDLLALPIDWNTVIDRAARHRILPLVHYHLTDRQVIPSPYRQLLHSHFVLTQCRAQMMLSEYAKVLQALHQHGIKTIALKGVVLATNIYPEVALRPFTDMDIVVRMSETESAFRVLADLGYRQGTYDPQNNVVIPLSDNQLQGFAEELQHYAEYIKADRSPLLPEGYPIDLHHRLSTIFDEFVYDVEELMERAVVISVGGAVVYRLDNEDSLLHLCSHLYWHTQSLRDILDERDAYLLAYTDIRSFLRCQPIDWDDLLERAGRRRLDVSLRSVLYQCHQLYGDVVPASVLADWDLAALHCADRVIVDRWITRNSVTKIGEWPMDFIDRLFLPDRGALALRSFYDSFIEPALHRGAVFKIVELGDPGR